MWKFISLLMFAFAFITLSSSKLQKEQSNNKYYLIDHLTIKVSSNINSFILTYEDTTPSPIWQQNNGKTNSIIVTIPVTNIKGKNKMMTEDLNKMLQSQQHPQIQITVPDYTRTTTNENSNINPEIPILLTITGKELLYTIPINIDTNSTNTSTINGAISFKLSDFGITPPEKYYGLIKVKNEVIVKFGLSIKP